jgi:cbb3-type cytochrome oxidase subunit 3
MTAWIMVICGCFIAVLGVLTRNGWRAAQYSRPVLAGWGTVAMGGGLAVDGLPRLLGWSSGVGFVWATVGLGLVVLGVVGQILSRAGRKARQEGRG